jgi:hypothetical protein
LTRLIEWVWDNMIWEWRVGERIKLAIYPKLKRVLRSIQNSFNGPMESPLDRVSIRTHATDLWAGEWLRIKIYPVLERVLRYVQESFNGPMESLIDRVSICTHCGRRRSGEACYGKGVRQ